MYLIFELILGLGLAARIITAFAARLVTGGMGRARLILVMAALSRCTPKAKQIATESWVKLQSVDSLKLRTSLHQHPTTYVAGKPYNTWITEGVDAQIYYRYTIPRIGSQAPKLVEQSRSMNLTTGQNEMLTSGEIALKLEQKMLTDISRTLYNNFLAMETKNALAALESALSSATLKTLALAAIASLGSLSEASAGVIPSSIPFKIKVKVLLKAKINAESIQASVLSKVFKSKKNCKQPHSNLWAWVEKICTERLSTKIWRAQGGNVYGYPTFTVLSKSVDTTGLDAALRSEMSKYVSKLSDTALLSAANIPGWTNIPLIAQTISSELSSWIATLNKKPENKTTIGSCLGKYPPVDAYCGTMPMYYLDRADTLPNDGVNPVLTTTKDIFFKQTIIEISHPNPFAVGSFKVGPITRSFDVWHQQTYGYLD